MLKSYRTSELLRALTVLRLCRSRKIVENSEKLMEAGKKILGRQGFSWLMKHSFYGQFVAGEDLVEMRTTVQRLNSCNVKTMFYVPVESDEGGSNTTNEERSALLDENLQLFLEGIREAGASTQDGMAQVKFTGLADTQFLLDFSEHMRTENMAPADGKESLVKASQDPSSLCHIPLPVLEKHKEHAVELTRRLSKLLDEGKQHQVLVIFDAEQTYFQPAIQRLILPLQLRYNRAASYPLVYTTLQAYLKETEDVLDGCLSLFSDQNVCFATKLVRGAYMHKERCRATSLGQPSPIQDSYEETNSAYQRSLFRLLESAGEGKASVMVSTHNMESIQMAKERMKQMGLSNSDGSKVCFGQLFGLADYLTSSLAEDGYRVYKSVPYGPVDMVLSYLSRRAQENNAVLDRAYREANFLWDEVRSRFLKKHTF